MTFLEERDFSEVPLIPEYFRGKTVFITGGSGNPSTKDSRWEIVVAMKQYLHIPFIGLGFIGKILIEKLLYSCSELNRIYLLLRTKKGVKSEERKDAIYKYACFDRLRSERPGLFESKVSIISGDVSAPNLGISEEDRILLVKEINIIFHSAASIRFDDPLKTAVKLNLLATMQIIDLAKEVKNLECFIHVSTAYSNKIRRPLEEKLYTPLMNWRELLEICKLDDHTIQVLTPKIIDGIPNTYILTKHLAEHMVYEERGKLPIVIVRPSIVINSLMEPIIGWNDNFNGPIGIVTALATGLSGKLYVDPSVKCDYIPVDLVVRALISSAWVRGTKKLEPADDIPIYNLCAGGYCNYTPTDLIEYTRKPIEIEPFELILPPTYEFTISKFSFLLHVLSTRLVLFTILDYLLELFSKKPRLQRLIRQIYIANLALAPFTMNEWTFTIDNVKKLSSILKETDAEEFGYKVESIEPYKYMNGCVSGTQKYLFKQRVEDAKKVLAKNNRKELTFMVVKILFYAFLMWNIITSNMMKTTISKITR